MIVVGTLLLMVVLAVLLPLRAVRPGLLGRLRWWVLGVIAAALVFAGATDPRGLLAGVFLAVFVTLVAWPVVGVGAVVVGALAVRSGLKPGPEAARATWVRLSWTWLLAAISVYGYGLTRAKGTFALDPGDSCRFGGSYDPDGHTSLLPLSDTTCGSEAVPGFVNPLLAVLVGLVVICAVGAVAAAARQGRARMEA
ncbi:hypothetical protein J4573_05260 [Actinomadura barringtoniae]|uniref:Uncharacterized protein n=1 Tax=Actinomadura barringtoniae TaxID=1427535 RepID=A0A939P6K5_9ACTN|nr:hypothetical protein [Actinomadura barringtoniae]MBO2446487.1 hypothetical protein [Actinomadura barringtoniae]